MEEKDLNVIEESDFADESKPAEVNAKPAEEVKPAEEEKPGVNLYNEDNEVDANYANGQPAFGKKKGVPAQKFVYEEEEFKQIEEARSVFAGHYRKRNIVKYIVTALVLVGVILGWLLPNTIGSAEWKEGKWPTYITLIVFVIMLVVLGVYSTISKKKGSKEVNDYLGKYFDLTTKYVLGDKNVQNLKGTIADKISEDELKNSALYKNIVRVGSRGKLTFEYENVPVTLVECSASRPNGKGFSTAFVGKMLTAPNSWEQDPIIVYIKGNKRALPPTNLDAFEVVSDTKTTVIYGKSKKRTLTQKTRDAIAQIRTDKVLVDCAIAIHPGKTYVLMGYEDSLMVPPFDRPFDPAPTTKYKEDLGVILNVVETLF